MMTKLRATLARVTRAARTVLRRALWGTVGAASGESVGEDRRAPMGAGAGDDETPRRVSWPRVVDLAGVMAPRPVACELTTQHRAYRLETMPPAGDRCHDRARQTPREIRRQETGTDRHRSTLAGHRAPRDLPTRGNHRTDRSPHRTD